MNRGGFGRAAKRILVVGLVAAAPGAAASRADQGRVPIYAPTTITQPGSYVLTRDIAITSGQAITIGASDVSLDLNGHTIAGSGAATALIAINHPSNGIRVSNGRLSGAGYGVNGLMGVPGTQGADLSIRGVEFTGQTAWAVDVGTADYFEMTGCTVKDVAAGVRLLSGDGSAGPRVTGLFTGNLVLQVAQDGLNLQGSRDFLVKDNIFTNVGSSSVYAVGGGLIVTKNVFNGPGTGTASGVVLYDGGNHVIENDFHNYGCAIEMQSSGNRVAGNLIAVAPAPAYSPIGILVAAFSGGADRNLIELNTLKLPVGCAINFGGSAHDNAYRTNVFRGGGTAVCDNGTGNTDGGANVY